MVGVALAWALGCGSATSSTAPQGVEPRPSGTVQQVSSQTCPTTLEAPSSLPGVAPEHGTADYWIGRAAGADDVLMSAVDIRAHNASFRRAAREAGPPVVGHFDLLTPPQPSALRKEVAERLAYMHERIEAGTYLDGQTSPLSERDKSVFAPPEASVAYGGGELLVVLAEVPLRCGPRAAGLYKKPEPGRVVDRAFDRNNCSTLRPQELVRVWRGTKRKGMRLVRSGYALGWLSSSAALSPPLSAESARAFATQDKLRVRRSIELRSETGATRKVGPRTLLASAPGDSSRALFATVDGVFESQVLGAAAVTSTRRSLTRQALLMEAFDYLGSPYGWGGQKAGRDCSRFMMDVFASFGVALPRYSSLQARAGNMVVDLRKAKSAPERMSLIDEAHTRGVVLLHFPGHIMLYLGRNDAGEPMAIHAFAEYLSPCPKAEGETLYRVREIRVSDLRLGAGSSRRSFLERITKLAVFGRTPGHALLGAVKRRPAAPLTPVESGPQADAQPACRSAKDIEWMTSPRHVHPGAPLRLIASSERDLGSVEILLRGPSGQRRQLEPRTVGGPPFGYWSQIPGDELATGRWTARIGEGEREEACLSFTVHPKPPFRQAGSGAVWVPTRTWNRRRENLYSTFVEQLFDFPPNEDHSWKSLQQLLSREDKNLFYDHLGQGEDSQLSLKPDCADLPYFLRAYFSWKMRLPFAFRHCNRGRKGKAPYCDRELHSHLDDREHAGEVRAFSHFARRNIADGVHSGSGRTGPDDSHTDYYPIALDRRSLRPGAVFADPYGHILIIADWVPQGVGSYGVLVGADAQPDGTVGRRRFWRGSFLFKPDTTEAGAGFKAFRPIRYRGGRMRGLKNEKITEATGAPPYSRQQYELSEDAFYETVEALINPRPLDPEAMLSTLVDALNEAVLRRVVSVQNGVEHKLAHRATIKMPTGHSIFETTGAWENFSTPSRDMRLLISIDTVLRFPENSKRQPQRYGLPAEEAALDDAVAGLEASLRKRLAAQSMHYVATNGTKQTLTLADVVKRSKGLEMAYNPNDCIEIRWAAPEGSAERASCVAHAPSHQTKRMLKYRSWFAERRRPPR